jgi:hypothetical protein
MHYSSIGGTRTRDGIKQHKSNQSWLDPYFESEANAEIVPSFFIWNKNYSRHAMHAHAMAQQNKQEALLPVTGCQSSYNSAGGFVTHVFEGRPSPNTIP